MIRKTPALQTIISWLSNGITRELSNLSGHGWRIRVRGA